MGGLNTVLADQERALAAGGQKAAQQGATAGKGGNILSAYMHSDHKRMSKMLGYCLVLNEPDKWAGFSVVARARMTIEERAALVVAALGSLPYQHAIETVSTVFGAAGDPLPPFLGGMEDARHWAGWASPNELKAYALAAFEAMPPKDKAAFFRHISTIEVAA